MEDLIFHLMAPSHGFDNHKAYMHYAQPADPSTIAVPCLNMFTMNDQIISRENIIMNGMYHTTNPNIITVHNRRGTHVIRWEGLSAQTCWISKVCFEFFRATDIVASMNREEAKLPK
uniref:Uncharacterized protein n=1 Tax=Lotharella globosa TaxID=91324 RepID=A0A7S3YZ55_9EUKA|mmetsp:Transcript_29035/g.56368  ORF Transcript_29035/g.56368 Transcript_29035/m.56368 type:complete len:117 (+) Transcript_29035:3-353(+)